MHSNSFYDSINLPVGTLVMVTMLIVILWLLRRWVRHRWVVRENLPAQLRKAALWASEYRLHINQPARLHGRLDQVFVVNHQLVVIDSKRRRRNRVYNSDKLEISAYALALSQQDNVYRQGLTVAGYGYVRVKTPVGVDYHRIHLLPAEKVIQAHQRYTALREHKAAPKYSPHLAVCQGCAYRPRCDRPGLG